MVPAVVVVCAVAIVLAVGLIVLALVGDDVAKREAVVGDDEIDALGRRLSARENVARPCHPGCDLAAHPWVAAPKTARGVAKAVVPFGERGAELAKSVAARADVPGLGDEAGFGEHGIGGEGLKERGLWIETRVASAKRRAEIETKAVETAMDHPALERADRHLNDQRAVKREAIAGARIVDVELRIVWVQPEPGAHCRARGRTASGRPGRSRRCG